ncbi:MAG TPA: Rieske 2Fe-2S domain-containing protein [Planctomycetota bacterium]|nr:Rieske 2Fe-2S domain-containing protein [Planctomycetota bacterium]
MTRFRAATLTELRSAGLMQRQLAGKKVLLVLAGGSVSAYEDRCAHLGLPLSGGRLEGGSLICPAHEWEYDARTGRGLNPSTACLKSFPVTIDREEILVDLE